MIFRPATQADINWVRRNLRESMAREFSKAGKSLDEVWQHYLSMEGMEWSAFVNVQEECVAVLGLAPVTIDFRPNTGFVILFTTPKVEEEPIGFLRAARRWLAQAFQGRPWDQIWTWVDEDNIKSYHMLTRFLGFERDKTVQPEQSEGPAVQVMHLLFHRREPLPGQKARA